MAGGFEILAAAFIDEPRIAESFRTGRGLGWHEHCACLFSGAERFFRPGYNANLMSSWIPSIEGVEARLNAGIEVADVGCGHGASALICTPASLIQEVALGLGAQAGEARLKAVTEEAGFNGFRRAAETPFNLVFEVRP